MTAMMTAEGRGDSPLLRRDIGIIVNPTHAGTSRAYSTLIAGLCESRFHYRTMVTTAVRSGRWQAEQLVDWGADAVIILGGDGTLRSAAPVLAAAEQQGETDWRVASALGTAYDQQGLYAKAREQYSKALAVDPQNLSVMNNLAMSYALEGNLKQAEAELRAADALPRSKGEPRIRQNLALVVGLEGRFDEATKLAQDDLPPEQVQENMAYLKKMLSQPNTWQQISEGGSQG